MIAVKVSLFGGGEAQGEMTSHPRIVRVPERAWEEVGEGELCHFLTKADKEEHGDLLPGASQEWLRRYNTVSEAKADGLRGFVYRPHKAFRVAREWSLAKD